MRRYTADELEALEDGFGYVPYALLDNQARSLSDLNRLQQSFFAVGTPMPAKFGGVYLDEDGLLVVNIVDDDIVFKEHVRQVLKDGSCYIRRVDHSLSYLESILGVLNSYLLNRSFEKNISSDTVGLNITSVGLDEIGNKIFVELVDNSDESVRKFRQSVIDSPVLEFRKSTGGVRPCVNINAGSIISSGTGNGSIGYRAQRSDGKKCVITAGHVCGIGPAHINSVSIGTCILSSLIGNCDAAVVNVTNANYTPTNTVNNTSCVLSTTIFSPPLNTVVYKQGIKTGHTVGNISRTSVTILSNGVNTITDTYEVTQASGAAFADHGDSGGTVYSYASSSYCLVGIIQGMSTTAGNLSYCSKAVNIRDRYSVSRY